MNVAIVGTGYVGLVTGTCLASLGHTVVCVDTNREKIALLRSGKVPIYEPGLEPLIKSAVAQGRLSFSTSIAEAAVGAEVVFIAVGTPTRAGGGEADLTYVQEAARAIASAAHDGLIIVTKSTVPVGTGTMIENVVRANRSDLKFSVASNPEFLKEGSAIGDFMKPDRIVIGSDDQWAMTKLKDLYAPLAANGAEILCTGRNAAEVIKYAANAFLAIKISFINEIADLCEAVSADVAEVANGVGYDKRIGRAFLNPGPGYGGSCFPKDSLALLATAQSHAVSLRVVESSIAANDARKRSIGRRVVRALGNSVRGKTVAILGLTFKANTDDMREAPAISIISTLQGLGANIRAYDPEGMEQARQYLREIEYAKDAYDCVSGADGIVIATEWSEFKNLDYSKVAGLVRNRTIVDLRNILDPKQIEDEGFELHRIGSARRNTISQFKGAQNRLVDDSDSMLSGGRHQENHATAITTVSNTRAAGAF